MPRLCSVSTHKHCERYYWQQCSWKWWTVRKYLRIFIESEFSAHIGNLCLRVLVHNLDNYELERMPSDLYVQAKPSNTGKVWISIIKKLTMNCSWKVYRPKISGWNYSVNIFSLSFIKKKKGKNRWKHLKSIYLISLYKEQYSQMKSIFRTRHQVTTHHWVTWG